MGFFDDLLSVGGDVINVAVQVATAPVQVVVNAASALGGQTGGAAVYSPIRDIGHAIGAVGDIISQPQKYLYQKAQQLARTVGGNVGVFALDLSTVLARYSSELSQSNWQVVAGVLQGHNPLNFVAAPLAAALRAAREQHIGNARPLPAEVIADLQTFIDASSLQEAKYAVGSVDITLPQFIGRGARFMGKDYAVVVGDVIVFNREPPGFRESAEATFWWSHETAHVQQYRRWGFETFAFRYLKDLGRAIETEADQVAERATRQIVRDDPNAAGTRVGSAFLDSVAYDMSSSPAVTHPTNINPECFVVQCVFPYDPRPVYFLGTNFGRIVAVDPFTGNWLHVGWATPPVAWGFAWTYQTPNFRYAVTPDGRIMTFVPTMDPWGRPIPQSVQVGHVVRL